MNENEELMQLFLTESDELFNTAESSLLSLETDPTSTPDVNELFRAFHTVKSGTAIVGFSIISEYVHKLENLLDKVRSDKIPMSRPLISFLLKDLDFLRDLVVRSAQESSEIVTADMFLDRKEQVERFLQQMATQGSVSDQKKQPDKKKTPDKPAGVDGSHYFNLTLRFQKDIYSTGYDPLHILLDLAKQGEFVEVNPNLSELPGYDQLDPHTMYLSWHIVLKSSAPIQKIREVFTVLPENNEIVVTDITHHFCDGVDLEAGEKTLGEILVDKGTVTVKDIKGALEKQKKLGEILVEEGKIDHEQLQSMVRDQEASRNIYRKTSIRVDVEKLDHLINLADEIGSSIYRIQQYFYQEGPFNMRACEMELENLSKVHLDFQDRVAHLRLFPLRKTFQRFQRIARDTAFSQNKQINIVEAGADVELDKEVIEYIVDPLKHLVRNCVDHGIEPQDERVAQGKPPEGTISFLAYRRGGKIYIQISDDGRGFDKEKLIKTALDRGLVRSVAELDDDALMNLVCSPGFSTASSVTEISGRGVGMDVVKTQVEQVGGQLKIDTAKGEGTTFTLTLPLTFALTEVLHIRNKKISYLIPLVGIMSSMRYDPDNLKRLSHGELVYKFRGDYLHLTDLSRIYPDTEQTTPEEMSPWRIIIFLDTGGKKFGLLVDEVLDRYHVIVKSIDKNYQDIKGIAGASIMGDGSLALVLDLFSLEEILCRISA